MGLVGYWLFASELTGRASLVVSKELAEHSLGGES